MTRPTIDYGMNLGASSCSIAVMRGAEPHLIPNREGALFTPSAVWIDKRGSVRVGRQAKERYINFGDDDVILELHQCMRAEPAGAPKRFVLANRVMSPAQLTAEMIKALKADVQMHTGEELRSLVITVPVDFEAPQNMQTEEAARLAGIEFSPLLPEPVAAALACDFQAKGSGAFWMVYDFGGGTFDAAIVEVEDDFIRVVEHAGDNYLGGKLVDWDIVDKLLAPAVQKLAKLPDFHRQTTDGVKRWRTQFAKLKGAAEQAKVEVSRLQKPFAIRIDEFMQDRDGKWVDLDFELQPAHLQSMYAPYIERSLNLCRNALQKKGLSAKALERVILVGGATQYPGLRDAVKAQLGVPLDFSIDPRTVVVRGAAMFAATQRVPEKALVEQGRASTVPGEPPEATCVTLPFDLGLARSDKSFDILVRKGSPLPTRAVTTRCLDREIVAGGGDRWGIPVVTRTGEHAGSQMMVGSLTIAGRDLEHSVPAGTEVQVTVKVTESLTVEANLYVPLLALDIDSVFQIGAERDHAVGDQRPYRLQLEYDPVGTTDAPEIVGKITSPAGEALAGYTIRISEAQLRWRSGAVALTRAGAFVVELHAEAGRRNDYTVEVLDGSGRVCPVEPSGFPYAMGEPPAAAHTSHDLGIACADNTVDLIFPRGTCVPARTKMNRKLPQEIVAGSDDVFRIPLVGGVHVRADRNPLVGYVTIRGRSINRSIPSGADVEITIKVTESMTLEASAYVPAIDQDFDTVLELRSKPPTIQELEQRLEVCRKRHADYLHLAQRSEDVQALQQLVRIERENLLAQATSYVATARGSAEHASEAEKRLLELMAALDLVEDALGPIPEDPASVSAASPGLRSVLGRDLSELLQPPPRMMKRLGPACPSSSVPELPEGVVSLAEVALRQAARVIGSQGTAAEKAQWHECEAEIHQARRSRDAAALREGIRRLAHLVNEVRRKHAR